MAELRVRTQLLTVTFEWSLYIPPPLTKPKWVKPLVIVSPWIVTMCPGVTWKIRKRGRISSGVGHCERLRGRRRDGDTSVLRSSSPLVRLIVPVTANSIVSPSFASASPDATSQGHCHPC